MEHVRLADHRGQQIPVGRLMAALISAVVLFQLNATMLSPAVTDLGERLDASAEQVGLQATVFFLSAALFGVFLPRLSDIAGRRPVILAVVAVANAGTVIGLLAPNIEVLYAARGVQGVCGVVVPMSLMVLRDAVPPERFGVHVGIITGVNGGVAGVDALLGGAIVDTVGFRGVFASILVVGLIAAGLVWRWLPDSRPSAGARMDWRGVALLCATIGLLTVGISGGSALLIGAAVALFAVFVLVERRRPDSLVPVRQMRDRGTWGLLLTTTLTLAGVFAAINFVLPLLAQDGFGMSASAASLLYLTPYALVGWLVAPFAGRLAQNIGYRKVFRIGVLGSVVALVVMVFGLSSPAVLVGCAVLLGVTAAGMANIMLNAMGVVYSPADNQGLLPGLNSAAFNVGASLGTAVLSSLVGQPGGYQWALGVAVMISLLALAVSFVLPAGHRQ